MAKAPAFQFYASDFYVGTSHFSVGEVGLYARGLAWSWDNGPLPLSDKVRAQVLLVTLSELRKLWPVVSVKWDKDADGYTNRRLEEERQKQADYRAKQSRKGKASAASRREPRFNRGSTTVQPEYEPRYQPEGQPEAQPEGNSSSSSSDFSQEQRGTPFGSDVVADITPPVWRQPGPRPETLVQPRSHHAKCFDAPLACARGLCIPAFLGRQWEAQAAVGQPEGYSASGAVIARVNAILAAAPPPEPGTDPLKWWRGQWQFNAPLATHAKRADYGGWRDECESEHAGACGNSQFHAAKMASEKVSA